jgi:hypothetical protein
MLTKISIGWVWLDRTLNSIIDAVNSQKPLQSASIAVEESPNGTLLKVVGTGQGQGQPTSDGGPVTWHNVGWMTVTVVDPANNCAQSQIKVLVIAQGSSVTIS